MKTTFTLVILFVLSLTTLQGYSKPHTGPGFIDKTNNSGEKKDITVGSDRKSGDIQLHVATIRAGKAVITILDASGKTRLQQTCLLTSSNNIIPLKNATRLTEGPYTVRVISNHQTYTTRFMIWK